MDSRSLRVALLSYRSLPTSGGQGVYLRHLSRELTALGHQVEVFSGPPYPLLDEGVALTKLPSLELYRQPDPFRVPHRLEFSDSIDALEFAIMCTGAFPEPLTGTLRAWRSVRKRLDDFDIIHDNQSVGYGLLGLQRDLRGTGIPMVATIHHPITVDRKLELAATRNLRLKLGLRRWYSFLRMQRRVAPRLDGILTVSDISTNDIQRDLGVRADQLAMVPLGVDPDMFAPADEAKVPGRIVVVTSADVPLKGLSVLLDALAKVRVEHDAHLVCVGKPKVGGPTDKRLDELGLRDVVTFRHGLPQDELIRLLQSAEVAVVPSFYEGFCLPAVEEMSCGLPLVATSVGALPEIVGTDGRAGVLIPPGDVEALATALGAMLDDPELRARVGAGARARVREKFTWAVTAAGTAEWYRERIAAKRGTVAATDVVAAGEVAC